MELKFSHKISAIDKALWQSLCPTDCPFISYDFLYALEESGSVSAETGWQPLHLQIIEHGITIAILPLYLKNHSFGEYVFDWVWADAYHRHGKNYYPKLVTASPFSPIEGPRLLTQKPIAPILKFIELNMEAICDKAGANSWHNLFISSTEKQALTDSNLMVRKGCQYHWLNDDYTCFADFLSTFNSRKRKNLKKERQKIIDQEIQHVRLSGHEISDELLDQFYEFYQLTYLKRGRDAYLNKDFFYLLRELIPDNLLLVVADKNAHPVAAALSLKTDSTLYGRYWGCFDEFDSLHFETCYYQGIEYCIENGIARFNSGAQGEHKIQRGFQPVPTWSAHWLKEQGLNTPIQRFITEETKQISSEINRLKTFLPFKH